MKKIINRIKLIYSYIIFSIAVRKCNSLNKKGGKFILINLSGKPLIINRQSFKRLRTKGLFNHSVKWSDLCKLNYIDYVAKRRRL